MFAQRIENEPTLDAARDRDRVAALENGLRALSAFSSSTQWLTLSDVARQAGLTRAAARRYLLTLTAAGYAETDGKRFQLTPRVLRLGFAYLSSVRLPQIAQPIVEGLGERTDEAAGLAVLDGLETMIVATSLSRRIVGIFTRIGTHLPAFSGSTGKVLMAGMNDDVVEQRLLRAGPIRKLTPKTKTSHAEIMDEIRRVREQGYGINDEEIELGLRVISVPVRNSMGTVVAAMCISTHSGRFEADQLKSRFYPPLVAASKQLSLLL
jgi:IclR family pca regulon transcriptional regulator